MKIERFIKKEIPFIPMREDLFNFTNETSLVRVKARAEGLVKLIDFPEVPTFIIPDTYHIKEYNFPFENYGTSIRSATEKVSRIVEKKGCSSNFFSALYEAILNAHQHGNKLDPNKSVTLAYEIKPNKIRAAVVDQGGVFEPDFMPFLINLRSKGDFKSKFQNYYDFSNTSKPTINNGTGTAFMHAYVDDVAYLKSSQGGLIVHLTKTF